MKKILYILLISLFGGSIFSCNYLNVEDYFDATLKYDSIFHSKKNLMNYLWGTAAMFPDESYIHIGSNYTPGPAACDECFSTYGTDFKGMAFVMGELTENNSCGLDNWWRMYRIIRKTNMILGRMNEVLDMTNTDKFEVLAYAHFMRAYAYYNILIDYGPVVLVGEKVYPNNEEASYYNNHRATYDESVDYICSEFEAAARYLPPKVLMTQFGRPTKGAAYALIARLRLQQASPLFNGGMTARIYYGSWLRKVDGVHYVSQQYDERKWAVAAAAAKRVIDMDIYKLHIVERDKNTPALPSTVSAENFPDGAGNVDALRSYSEMFTGESIVQRNEEAIWGRHSGGINHIMPHCFPAFLGGWNGGLVVTQKVVDEYLMADGRTTSNSSDDYPYDENHMFSMNDKGFSGYKFTTSKQISGMYVNREARFYASIGFSGRLWPALSSSQTEYTNYTATYDLSGNSGRYSSTNVNYNYPSTGYPITKFIHENDALTGNGAIVLAKPYYIIRYAEILLSYAEALNHLEGNHEITLGVENNEYTTSVSRNLDEISKAFNQVRYRVALPGLTPEDKATEESIQNCIERERMVEFLFENRRYYDVRRWGIYEATESVPVMGMNIEATEPLYYSRTIINHRYVRNRIIHKKMIFLPIPKSEVRKVEDLDQNIGWGD